MGAPVHHQQQAQQHQTYHEGCAAGMRLFASAIFAATALSQVADSGAWPSNPHAVLHGISCELGGPVPFGCKRLGVAGDRGGGILASHALSTLRGGGFGWGTPEEPPKPSGRRAASGMFGASWGGGSTDGSNTNDQRERVDTRGPPDLNSRLPATAPGSDGGGKGGGGGFFGGVGGGGGASSRERVRTVGPPDAGGEGATATGIGGRAGRRGFFSSGSASPTAPFQSQQAGGRFGGGRADPRWTGAKPNKAFGGRVAVGRDDGEGEGPIRGWGEGGSGTSDRNRGLMAVHLLVLSCFGLFSLNTIFGVDGLIGLSLNHARPRWWQTITSVLVHGDQHHLMGNMFNLIIFGKMAEEDMGSVGMLASFVACGVASSFASLIIMPKTAISCGASGAIFGLYSVCVLGKLFNIGQRHPSGGRLRKLIEAAVFGWFVVDSVMSEMRMVVAGGVTGIDHAAHFGGVFAGALLILVLRRSFREQNMRERSWRGRGA